jgi:hypothetical protein
MTKFRSMSLFVALGVLVVPVGPAAATATVDLVWTASSNPAAAGGLGTNTIAAAPGDLVTLAVVFTPFSSDGVSVYGVSVRFDFDLLDELDLSGAPEEFGMKPTITCTPFPSCFFESPTMSPFTPGVSSVVESNLGFTGFVYTFEAGTCGNGPTDTFGAFKIGEIHFQVNSSVMTDGFDIESGFFNVGTDGAFSNPGQPIDMTFGSASLDQIPEPATLVLVAAGLAAFAARTRIRWH